MLGRCLSDSPALAPSSIDALAVNNDSNHFIACALGNASTDRELTCWGHEYYLNSVPPAAYDLPRKQFIAFGGNTACVANQSSLVCWKSGGGTSSSYFLSEGHQINGLAVADYRVCIASNIDVICGNEALGFVDDNGNADDWFGEGYQVRPEPEFTAEIAQLKAGYRHFCALVDGDIQCWGNTGVYEPIGAAPNTLLIDPDRDGISSMAGQDRNPYVAAGPDSDNDEDGILDTDDNCVAAFNPDQQDTDLDGEGDACDNDDDNDGFIDNDDDFPVYPNEWRDSDGDGYGDNLNGWCKDYGFYGSQPGIVMESQAELDQFQTLVGPCHSYAGSISLGGYGDDSNGPMTDLSPISTLVHVGGTLGIGASELETLPQMSLETVGLLKLDTTLKLPSLSGLESLREIGGLWISYTQSLTDLSALSNLELQPDLPLSLTLIDVQGLQNLVGLEGIQGEINSLRIEFNYQLSDISQLSNITGISGGAHGNGFAGGLWITSNESLTSLEGLNNLESAGGAFSIQSNSSLTDCSALYKVLGWPTQPWDPNSDGVAGSVEIEANGAGANSPDDCLNSYENSSPNEVVDTDSDGVPDDQDAFPTPFFLDGYPDAWNSNAIADSSLVLDAFPNDPTEYFDSDGDGVGDSQDPDPQNPGIFMEKISTIKICCHVRADLALLFLRFLPRKRQHHN